MIVIDKRRPRLLGILGILDAYIEHQKEIVYKRSQFDLDHAQKRFHIVEGLIKAISILDKVISTIRASKNRGDAIENLVIKFAFTEEQATAIVDLRLYRLTNTDIVELETEKENLLKIIKYLESILGNENNLKSVIKEELRRIKKEYGNPRRTTIQAEVEDLKIDTTVMLPKEDVVVVLTKEGYIKRVSLRSYNSSNSEETGLKENDYVLGTFSLNTLDTLLIFTNLGNYLYLPVYELPEGKWKELGKHISNIIPISSEEKIISAMPVYNFEEELYITSFSKNGMIKRTKLSEFKVQRYSKPIKMMNLKGNDEVVSVTYSSETNVFVATKNGYGLWYQVDEVSPIGLKGAGVKAINLKNDEVAKGLLFDSQNEYISILMDKGTGKRIKLSDFEMGTRANRGLLLMKEIKSNPSKIMDVYIEHPKNQVGIITDKETKIVKLTELPIMDRYSNGSYIVKDHIIDTYKVMPLIDKENYCSKETPDNKNTKPVSPTKEKSLKEIDDQIMTIDDLLNNMDK